MAGKDKRAKYLKIFRAEADEHLKTLDRGLLALEKNPGDVEVIHEILRSAHTLKGSARMLGLEEIGEIAHKMEDVLKAVEDGELPITAEMIDVVFEGHDAINNLVETMTQGKTPDLDLQKLLDKLVALFDENPDQADQEPQAEPIAPAADEPPEEPQAQPETTQAPAPPPAPVTAEVKTEVKTAAAEPQTAQLETIRVEAERLDQMVDLAGELMINKIKLDGIGFGAKKILQGLDVLLANWDSYCNGSGDKGRADLVRLHAGFQEFFQEYTEDLMELDVNTQEMQSQALSLRMLPASVVFDEFPRYVRDIARSLGKQIELKITGQQTELDKRLLEQIKGPLIHILRNACDHGTEPPQQRQALGKPPTAVIQVSAHHRGGNVVIEIKDDGAGMNIDRIKEVALSRGIVDEQSLDLMSEEEVIYLTLQPGFSTSEIITDLSGRGVGLDVVKTNIENLRGDMFIESTPGQGTKITLTLPLTVAIINCLLVLQGGDVYAIPLNFVEETVRVMVGDLLTERGREVITVRGTVVPIIRIRDLLGMDPLPGHQQELSSGKDYLNLVVLRFRNQRLAIEVERFIRDQEIIVKSLGNHLKSVHMVAGATILRKGEPALILNVFDIFAAAESWRGTGIKAEFDAQAIHDRVQHILVVDDSITTRTIEKNILERSGYKIDLAVNGEEALKKAAQKDYDLFVVDVEMPGITGFELTEKLRQDERTQDTPVIICTSLSSDEHKRRGIEVGAQAYIVKGAFDQNVLIQTVRSLIGE